MEENQLLLKTLSDAEPADKSTYCPNYVFTLNNYSEEEVKKIEEMFTILKLNYLIIGFEVGKEGTPHIQGFLNKKEKVRFNALKRHMPRAWIHKANAKGKKLKNAWDYCKKDGKFKEFGEVPKQGERTDIELFKDAVKDCNGNLTKKELLENHSSLAIRARSFCNEYINMIRVENIQTPDIQLTLWQKKLLYILTQEEHPTRVIIWIWSDASRTGKSTFMKFIASILKSEYFKTDDLNKRNIMYAFDRQKVLHFDLPRDLSLEARTYLKGTLETFSDGGLQFSSKYESCLKDIGNPWIVVTSNQPPLSDELPKRIISIEVGDLKKEEFISRDCTDEKYNHIWTTNYKEYLVHEAAKEQEKIQQAMPEVDNIAKKSDVNSEEEEYLEMLANQVEEASTNIEELSKLARQVGSQLNSANIKNILPPDTKPVKRRVRKIVKRVEPVKKAKLVEDISSSSSDEDFTKAEKRYMKEAALHKVNEEKAIRDYEERAKKEEEKRKKRREREEAMNNIPELPEDYNLTKE